MRKILGGVLLITSWLSASGQAPVTSTQIFNYNATFPALLDHLQRLDGTVDSTSFQNFGFALSSVMHVQPGATLTWHSPASALADKGLFFGSGGPYPTVEYFQDEAATQLVSVDLGLTYNAHDQTFIVPSTPTIRFVRIQLTFSQNYAYISLSGATLTTDTPFIPPAPSINLLPIPVHNFTDAPFLISASSNSTGALTYSVVSGPAVISGATVTLSGLPGTVILNATQAPDSNYASGSATESFLVVQQSAGTPGPQGLQGLSAYQVAVANGYTGSQTAWLASLVGSASVKPLAGMRCGFVGDSTTSYNSWESTFLAITGCTEVFRDARPGRRIDQAFEAYHDDPYSGKNQGGVAISSALPGGGGTLTNVGTCGGGANCGGIVGNTLAQDLANVDILVAGYTTNDIIQHTPIGAYGAAPAPTFPEAAVSPVTSGTLYGYEAGFFKALYTANPAMKVLSWGPYQISAGTYLQDLVSYEMVDQNVARDWGTPFFDGRQFGISDVTGNTSNIYLLPDGVHPSAVGGTTLIGPRLARFAAQFATQ